MSNLQVSTNFRSHYGDDSERNLITLCDGGERYRSRLWNRAWLEENECVPTARDLSFV